MRVKFFATYRQLAGADMMELQAPADVGALLHEMAERYSALGSKILAPDGLTPAWDAIVLVNGRNIEHLRGMATPLKNTDTVQLFPLVAGG